MIKFWFSISQDLVIGLLGTRDLLGITKRFTSERPKRPYDYQRAFVIKRREKSLKRRRRSWAAYVTWWPQFVDVNSLAVYHGDTRLACYSRKLFCRRWRAVVWWSKPSWGSVVGSAMPLLAYFCSSYCLMTSVVRCTRDVSLAVI